MPKITLNGEEVEFQEGQTVIEVATERGTVVPHYCWHPALSVVASCRICQVEIHGPGPKRLATACNTPAVDGMVVTTESDDVSKARAGNLEALLLNHPLDCPICDKAGECWLQDYTYEYGASTGRNDFPRRKLEKRKDIADHVLLDQERCILCTRCVRFLDDYAKKPELVVTSRGERSTIDIFADQKVTSEYSGNLADICPVGALTLKEFRFVNRVWYLRGTDSVCPSCSRGCSITLDVRDNELNRVRPRTNREVNGWFICDEGRFGLLDVYHPGGRLEHVRVDGDDAVLEVAARAIAERLKADGDLLVLASPDATNEELFLLKRVVGGLDGKATLAFAKVETADGDDILRTGEPAANVAGLRFQGFEELDAAALKRALGAAKTAWVLDRNVHALDPRPGFVVVQAVTSALADDADVVLPGGTVGEKEGTLTNVDERLQRIRPALKPPATVPGDFRALLAVGEALGVDGLPRTPGEAFMAWADTFGGTELTLAGLPRDGLLRGEAAAPAAKEKQA